MLVVGHKWRMWWDPYMAHETAYLPYDFHICGSGAIIRGNSVDNTDDVALHHADVVGMTTPLCQVEKVLDEVHDVGTGVHVVLCVQVSRWSVVLWGHAYPFKLLKDTRVQILVHVFVLEGILGSFLCGSDGCVEVLQLRGEAHTHFERVSHGGGGQMSLSVYVDAVYVCVYGL